MLHFHASIEPRARTVKWISCTRTIFNVHWAVEQHSKETSSSEWRSLLSHLSTCDDCQQLADGISYEEKKRPRRMCRLNRINRFSIRMKIRWIRLRPLILLSNQFELASCVSIGRPKRHNWISLWQPKTCSLCKWAARARVKISKNDGKKTAKIMCLRSPSSKYT